MTDTIKGNIVQYGNKSDSQQEQDPSINLNKKSSLFMDMLKRQNNSPFSLEFKRIVSSQVFDYGTNFSIEIPIVGNI